MLKDIIAVKPLKEYKLHLCFEDGIEGVVDVSEIIEFTGVFAPLKEFSYFKKVQLHPELGTIFWENGADLDPDVLYARVTGKAIPNYERRLLVN